ncbi:MAG: ATP-dependent Clp protease ATP-binding subunit [Clostridiaceae bacterium]|nr:ATP-dependent Clp protease ATP-binding subunit [Clostridiaceae bacterium]
MSKCSICKVNEAVVFANKLKDGVNRIEGVCLKCAYEQDLGGMTNLFERVGVTDDNVDEITSRVNQMMEQFSGQNPEEVLGMLLKGQFPDLSGVEWAGSDDDSDYEETEEEDADSNDRRLSSRHDDRLIPQDSYGELVPANIGNPEDDDRSRRPRRKPRRKFLEQFSTNLSQKAANGEIDRVIGRDDELNHLIQILNRRTKNNPALIGEPGVGKTAIAEGLAVRIHEGKVPAKLLNQEMFLLDMTGMVAGTQFRGQFESRMKGVVEDCRRSGNVILVIDELHNIMGAGDAEGAMNAGNILKPALAKGEIRVIGSTTLDEYRRHIEKDSALERRFQKVMVEEPSKEDTYEILMGIKDYYENHHHVLYPEPVVREAVRLSSRYITERYLPDKAIDLLDEAGSCANLACKCLVEIKQLDDKIQELEFVQEDFEKLISESTAENEQVDLYAKHMEIRSELMRMRSQREETAKNCPPVEIETQDIAQVVEMWTGIPVVRMTEEETTRLIQLEERLHQRVVGQNDAVNALSRAIRRHRAGFSQEHKPASFLFVGPTGVGKTELVKALAEVMFDTEDSLVRLDMSEYMEAHTVSKLIGSPPGYIGYDDGGQLTEQIRRKPYSVVLFDEIEKAHADVYNILLQIMDDGRLTDSHGRVVSFENCIIVMTSNAGTTLKGNTIGFGSDGHVAMEERIDGVLKDIFRPEFLNRIDETIVFHELTAEEIRAIVDLMLKDPFTDMKRRNIDLQITDDARDLLAKEGYEPKYGARPLRRKIQRRIEDVLADLWLSGDLYYAEKVIVDAADNVEAELESPNMGGPHFDDSGNYAFIWENKVMSLKKT